MWSNFNSSPWFCKDESRGTVLRTVCTRPLGRRRAPRCWHRKTICGCAIPVEQETVRLDSAITVIHSKQPWHERMKSFLLLLICPMVNDF